MSALRRVLVLLFVLVGQPSWAQPLRYVAEPEIATELPLDNRQRVIYRWAAPRAFPRGTIFDVRGNYQLMLQGTSITAKATMFVVDVVLVFPDGQELYFSRPNGENIASHAQHYTTGPEVADWEATRDVPVGSRIELRARSASTTAKLPLIVKQSYGRMTVIVSAPVAGATPKAAAAPDEAIEAPPPEPTGTRPMPRGLSREQIEEHLLQGYAPPPAPKANRRPLNDPR